MKHLYFIRHGEAFNNLNGNEFIGGHHNFKLTKKGKHDALFVGKQIASSSIKFDLVICSPLNRARDTAQIICPEIGYPLDKIVFLDELMERDFGSLAGKKFTEGLGMSHKEYIQNPLAADEFEEIEPLRDLHERAKIAVDKIKQFPADNILIISHAAIGKSIQRVINGVVFDTPIPKVPNAELIKLL